DRGALRRWANDAVPLIDEVWRRSDVFLRRRRFGESAIVILPQVLHVGVTLAGLQRRPRFTALFTGPVEPNSVLIPLCDEDHTTQLFVGCVRQARLAGFLEACGVAFVV